jgi:secreted PhoX family phosphatase
MTLLAFALLVSCGQQTSPIENSQTQNEQEPLWVFAEAVSPDPLSAAMSPTTMKTATRGSQTVEVGYDVLLRVGQVVNDWEFGRIADSDGMPIEGDVGYCNRVDYSGLFEAHGGLWVIGHLECIPGGLQLTKLEQDPLSGDLSVLWSRPIPNESVNGTWLPCAGHMTSWGTVLSSEEYEADAADAGVPETRTAANMARMATWNKTGRPVSPYHYGWIPEMTLTDASGTVAIEKHYAMGRFSHEVARVLGDEKTVMMSDDQRGAGFFMFVADMPREFDAGVLYAAKMSLTGEISWVSLGHSDGRDVQNALEAGVVFTDLFERTTPAEDLSCPDSYALTSTASGDECLRLNAEGVFGAGVASLASRLESRRYAALMGATTEFVKAEGIAYDQDSSQLMLALTLSAASSTAEAEGSVRQDHLQFAPNYCGKILSGPLNAGVLDTNGEAIASMEVLTSFSTLMAGREVVVDGREMCDTQFISNPDNIAIMHGQNKLLISEDSGYHVLNRLWSYDMESGELTALQLSPLVGEMSGAQWFQNIGGFDYIASAVQHPFRFAKDDPNWVEATDADRASYMGFIGPFPTTVHQ